MNYISQLTTDRDEARAQVQRMQNDLIEIQAYLSSSKFHGLDSDWVSAREMWRKLQDVRVNAWMTP
jgi:septation ring formation regulator EzrA